MATGTKKKQEAQQSDTNGNANGNGNGNGNRAPVKVFTFQVGHGTYVQASVWDRVGRRQDGTEFTTYDVSIRKRYRDDSGEFKSAYSFSASELFAVTHAINAANAYVTELRAADVPF